MTNKHLLPLAIAILIITTTTLSVIQFKKSGDNNNSDFNRSNVSEDSSVSLINRISPNSNTKYSSVSAESEAPKSSIQTSKKQINTTCNIPAEMMKYKSDSGCYMFQVSIPYDADDSYPLKSKELADFSRTILGEDFYSKIKGTSNSSYISIFARSASKVSENIFDVRLGFLDIEYLKSNNITGTDADTFEGEYTVNLNEKSFKLNKFSDRTKK
jgi:hypothetical protein